MLLLVFILGVAMITIHGHTIKMSMKGGHAAVTGGATTTSKKFSDKNVHFTFFQI